MNSFFSQILNSEIVDLPQVTADQSQSNTLFSVLSGIAIGIALLIFVIGAFMLSMSQGDPQRIKSARETMIYAVIGFVVTIAARLIVGYILDLG